MERFFHVNALHGADVGAVAAVRQRRLVHDRGAIDEPLDHDHVGPRRRRVIKHVVVLGLAGDQVAQHLVARLAQILRYAIQHLAVADLILHLGDQGQLAPQARRPRDPFAFRQGADDLGVGVVLGHAQHADAVIVRHPVIRLDQTALVDTFLERAELFRILLNVPIEFQFDASTNGHRQTPSRIVATPCPTPTHSVARPRRAPVRRI